MIPRGGDPHSFEPSMRDRERARRTPRSSSPTAAASRSCSTTPSTPSPTTAPRCYGSSTTSTDGDDPHVWFDPTLVADAAAAIADALVAAGADEAAIAAVPRRVQRRDWTHSTPRSPTSSSAVPPDRRLLVTNHDALGYFADRYGFEIVGTVLPGTSTLAEAIPGRARAIWPTTIEATGVPAIFAESLASTDEADGARRRPRRRRRRRCTPTRSATTGPAPRRTPS